MPYRVTLAEGSITVTFDTPAEGAAAYEAVRHLIGYLGSAPAFSPTPPPLLEAPPSEPPEASVAERVSKVYGGSGITGIHHHHHFGSRQQRERIKAWFGVLQEINSNENGLSPTEMCNRLRVSGPSGIGRSFIPTRQLLMRHGMGELDDCYVRTYIGKLVRYYRTAKTAVAIEILRGYFETAE